MKNSNFKLPLVLILMLYSLLSVYIVYEQATDANAIDLQRQEERHLRMLEGNSEFFNPWQYRMFSTVVTEGFYRVIHAIVPTVDRTQCFLLFRFLQNLLIFFVADYYFRALAVHNPLLRLVGVTLLGVSMAHSVFQSDLSFNTYFDILFYVLGALLILREKYVWLIPLMAVAAFNRETSALIPAMLVVLHINWPKLSIPKPVLLYGLASGLVFVFVFVGVRLYYGFQPAEGIHGMRSITDYLIFNLKFFRMYPELIGTLLIVPFVIVFYLKRLPAVIQKWFWLVCPIWFVIHLCYSTAVETRLFLVPQALIFIPALLILVEGWYTNSLQVQRDAV
ncbi:MAG: hypothetical protein KF803_16980 [Cyclobacteriaceae bacterium]|nr:hypothetical protein [Cyclobacteriaceae bacterium]